MIDVEVIDTPDAATVALEPIRSRILAELAEPASAATLASRLTAYNITPDGQEDKAVETVYERQPDSK